MSTPEPKDYRELFKRALLKLDDLQARLDKLREPIAVIGMSCRFPNGANDPEKFWQLLREGVDGITEIPPERWNAEDYYDPDPNAPGKMYTRCAGFLDEVDKFDPQFFGIAPREAVSMDPQQRLLLEVTWEALERAGQAPAKLMGSRTGVYVGISGNDYSHLQSKSGNSEYIDTYFGAGVAHSIASGRISYVLGLQGPSVSVDTACSASLTAVHLACQSLRLGESDMALAGGVNVILSPDGLVTASQARMLSPDGRCKTFDASANGYVRSEGCAMIVLKRLSDAVANRDNILALIRGTAANQDGRSGGLTAPNGEAQQAVVREALNQSGLQPGDVTYLETHGTGTSLGDPIEVQSLAAVFGENRVKEKPLLLGAVKSNIGHLEAAAGIAGLLKVILSLQHEQIPPSLHVKQLNPHIAWEQYPLKVTTALMPWPAENGRRIAGVSSFGFSGTNVHVVVEEAPAISDRLPVHRDQPAMSNQLVADRGSAATDSRRERPLHVLTLSAKSEAALKELAGRYQRHLAAPADHDFADFCFTANSGRAHFNHRLALTAASPEQAREKLAAFVAGETPAGMQAGKIEEGHRAEVAFLFTGQGSQYAGMGCRLYETEPVFRAALDKCDEILRPHLDKPLVAVINNQASLITENLLDQTAYTQPALFAIEYALAELWRSWGIVPAMVMGHSVGEYVAACVAGVFSLEDGLKLIAARGRLMQALPQNGSMVAVFAAEEKIKNAVAPHADQVAIAACNGPANIVISGARDTVNRIVEKLAGEGIKSKPLTVSHAFHSPLMEPILDEFAKTAGGIKHQTPRIGFVSNLTGQLFDFSFDDPQATIRDARAYWRRHVREAVRFSEGINTLYRQGCKIFVEIGPNPTLLSMGQRCLPEGAAVTWLPSLRKGREDWQALLETLSGLYVHGVPVDWEKYDRHYPRRRVILPTYPFQRGRYWAGAAEQNRRSKPEAGGSRSTSHDAPSAARPPLLGQRLRSALREIQFEAQISIAMLPFLNDHQFYGRAVFPAAAYLEMALAAAREVLGAGPHRIESVNIHEPLFLSAGEVYTLQTIVIPEDEGMAVFKIYSLDETGENKKHSWRLHASGSMRRAAAGGEIGHESLAAIGQRCPQKLEVAAYYEKLSELGVDYGPAFQGLVSISRGGREALGQISLPPAGLAGAGAFALHPALLDACFQLAGAALYEMNEESAAENIYMPVGLRRLEFRRDAGARVWCHFRLLANAGENAESISGNLHVLDDGGVVAEVEELQFKRARRETLLRAAQKQWHDWLYEIEWQPQTLAEAQQASETSPAGKPGRWLIFADQHGAGAALAQQLKEQGESCVLVFAGSRFERGPGEVWTIHPSRREDFERVFHETCFAHNAECRGVVHLWSLQAEVAPEAAADELRAAEKLVCESALLLVQVLARASFPNAPRLWLITRNAQSIDSQSASLALAAASLWGLGNVIDLEHPALRCARIDLEAGPVAGQAALLFRELQANTCEPQVAFRHNRRYVARLAHAKTGERETASPPIFEERPVKLEIKERGLLENLTLSPLRRRPPQRGEVEVQVLATGLNFRDVLNALGMYPGDPGPLGNECVGKIVALGEGVEGLALGEEVMVLAADSFASYVTVAASCVLPKAKHLSVEEAATVPLAFLTAHYALNHLARMSAGERVLIHAAAGGVGLAAIQLAQRAGAEIFATAGSAEKHAYLRSLGIKHIMSSRHLDFAGEILAATHGEGVDIVLNSLAGDFIPQSLSLLRPRGRFLEIGKTGVWDEAKVKALKPEAAYHVIYLGQTMQEQPQLMRALFLELAGAFEKGELKPLPCKTFPLEEAAGAFRYMAAAKHIGKVVITQKSADRGPAMVDRRLKAAITASPATVCDSQATYLVTGGLGALGLKVAEWLAAKGAKHLVLTGRKAPNAAANAAIEKMKKNGAQVVVMPADISRQEEVAGILAEIARTLPPLRGIVHTAGVLEDGILQQQDWPRFEKVMAPKVEGSWHLHRLTENLPLDFFVLFSSIASMFGASGQGNYAAANAFMDGLAHYRRARGLPATSINWGPWAEAGMVADLGKRGEQRMKQKGLGLIAPEQGVQIFEQALAAAFTQVAVLPVSWPKFLKQFEPRKEPPLFSNMIAPAAPARTAPAPENRPAHFVEQLQHALPGERLALLTAHVREQVVKVLGLEASQAPALHQGLTDIGMDSLMAVELSNSFRASLGRALPATLAFEYPTIAALTDYLATEVLHWDASEETAAPKIPAPNGNAAGREQIEGLAEGELEESLLKELQEAGY